MPPAPLDRPLPEQPGRLVEVFADLAERPARRQAHEEAIEGQAEAPRPALPDDGEREGAVVPMPAATDADQNCPRSSPGFRLVRPRAAPGVGPVRGLPSVPKRPRRQARPSAKAFRGSVGCSNLVGPTALKVRPLPLPVKGNLGPLTSSADARRREVESERTAARVRREGLVPRPGPGPSAQGACGISTCSSRYTARFFDRCAPIDAKRARRFGVNSVLATPACPSCLNTRCRAVFGSLS
jgi:hypothetical protein